MADEKSVLVRVISEEEIRRIVPVLPYRTSCGLNWSGVEVHRYRLPAGETREHSYPQLAVFLSHVDAPHTGELRVGGRRIRAQISNNSVSIAPPGVRVSGRRDGPAEVTVIFLEPGADDAEVLPQYGIEDPLIRALGMALDAEMQTPHPGHKAYAESLAAAMSAHILAKYTNPDYSLLRGVSARRPQLKAQLGRCLEYIHDYLEADLSLEDMAAVANMSKYHFARTFRQAMGIAPHQYVVKLRVEKARRLLAGDALSVEEVARRVGYADKGHFAEQFRKIMGMSPNRYRQDLMPRIPAGIPKNATEQAIINNV